MTCLEQVLSNLSAYHTRTDNRHMLTARCQLFLQLPKTLNMIDMPYQILRQTLRENRMSTHR